MSRSGYTDDCDQWASIRWRGAVRSAIRGKRGQGLLRELLAALDAMPVKRLITNELQINTEFCTLGALGAARGLNMSDIDPEEPEFVAQAFGIAHALAAEIMYENDDGYWSRVGDSSIESAEKRWTYMRAWVAAQIQK